MKMNESGVILLVEDNLKILDANRRILSENGYVVLTADTLQKARKHLKTTDPDVVVLDIMLPDGNGLDFLSELRETCAAPVLFLTAKDEREDKLKGLRAGGNDYITKPYDIDEFRERVVNFLRFARRPPPRTKIGALELDVAASMAFLNGEDMALSPKEFALLRLFVQNEGIALSADCLYEKVWKAVMGEDTQAVRSSVSRLRAKLNDSGFTITSQRNEGYCFEKV
jgi:DNA-binding response OmpR family regulator